MLNVPPMVSFSFSKTALDASHPFSAKPAELEAMPILSPSSSFYFKLPSMISYIAFLREIEELDIFN